MITVPEIREHLVDLLASEADKNNALSLFEDWFVQASWNMHKTSGIRAQKFASEIELSLAENEADLKSLWKRLKEILDANPFWPSEEVRIVTGASSSYFTGPREWAFSSVDKLHAAACV